MPSAFTHVLVGGATAGLLPRELPRTRIALALGLAAALPDLDVAAFALGIPYTYPLGHRGITHSLLFAALFGGAVAWLAARTATREPAHVRGRAGALLAVGFLAVASHGLLDAFTNAGEGIGFLIPFDDGRYFSPWRPIETASVHPARFFTSRGLAVLASEILWVWLPLLGLAIVWRLVARSRTR